jgi:hypothetical protein
LLHWKTNLIINAKFLAGCHYNEEEFRRHLKKKYRILAGPNEWQQVCNQSNPEETGRSCEVADFSWLSSKVSRTLDIWSIAWDVVLNPPPPPSMGCIFDLNLFGNEVCSFVYKNKNKNKKTFNMEIKVCCRMVDTCNATQNNISY